MEEIKIQAETAILAQEVGCDILPQGYEFIDKETGDSFWTNKEGGLSGEEDTYPAGITQALLEQWLRTKDIFISCHRSEYKNQMMEGFETEYSTTVSDWSSTKELGNDMLGFVQKQPVNHEHTIGDTYEEALEKALVEGLKMVQKNG